MSDYRHQITEHNGIQCLHVMTEVADHENVLDPDIEDGIAHAYIPVDDIQESFIRYNVPNKHDQELAKSILHVSKVVMDEIERLNKMEDANAIPDSTINMLFNAMMNTFEAIINICNAQFPMKIEVSEEQRERLKARLKEMEEEHE